ncbi:O-antigen ligase family protein [Priestia megaterium]|uniref:O-antigen ligase family protein n=1 Tax=Priestia megaterium TaxID=1404 RepID=UPI00211CF0F9|nr:O-antigen ligase family protein [Priestia megaterium]
MKSNIPEKSQNLLTLSILLFLNLIFTQLGIKIGFLINIGLIITYTIVILASLSIFKNLHLNISYIMLWVFYGFFVLISYFHSLNLSDSIAYTLKVLCVLLCTLFMTHLTFVNKDLQQFEYNVQKVFRYFFYIFVGVTLIGYLFYDQYILIMSHFLPDSYLEKIEGYHLNNRFGGLGLATGTNCYVIIILSYLGNVYSTKYKVLNYTNFVLIFLAILISGARSPLISWSISLFVYFILNKKLIHYMFKDNIYRTVVKTTIVLIVILGGIITINNHALNSSYRSLDFSQSESIYQRKDLSLYAWGKFIDSQGLGIGIANIPYVSSLDNGVGRLNEITNTHNIYLQTLAETGLGGFLSLILIIIYTFVVDIKAIKKFRNKAWIRGVATTSIVFWIYGFISNPLYDFQTLFIFLISKSLLLGYISADRSSLNVNNISYNK